MPHRNAPIPSTPLQGASGIEKDSPRAFKSHLCVLVESTPEGTRYTKVLPPSSRRQATVHRTVAFKFSSPFYWEYKNGVSRMGYTVFGTPEGTRTPNPRNRNPMLYPLSHWRISESPIIIAGFPGFVKRKWKKFLLPADSFRANGCFSQ